MTLIAMTLMGYAAIALWSAHLTFARQRSRFLTRRADRADEPAAQRMFQRQEREQAKAIALLVGSTWPVSGPLLAARRLIAAAVTGRPSARPRGRRATERQRRIRQLEQELGLSPSVQGASGPGDR